MHTILCPAIASRRRLLLAGGLLILLATLVARPRNAQADFEFLDFSSTTDINLVGDAETFANRLRLTPAAFGQVGGAWFADKQAVAAGFRASFAFEVSDPDPNFGADGFAFIIQDDSPSALGAGGSSLGFMDVGDGPGLDNFLAVEFDTLNSGITFDEDGNHIAVQSRSKSLPQNRVFLGSANPPFSIQGGGIHTAQIAYQPGMLSIAVDGASVPLLQVSVDLATLLELENEEAWVGFTAATGGAWENHDMLSWSFESIPEPSGLVAALVGGLTLPVVRRPQRRRHAAAIE